MTTQTPAAVTAVVAAVAVAAAVAVVMRLLPRRVLLKVKALTPSRQCGST